MIVQTQCIRCGKLRILARTWSEHIGLSDVTYSENVCPDTECQKLVEALLKERRDIQTNRMQVSLQRRKDNREKSVLIRKERLLKESKRLARHSH